MRPRLIAALLVAPLAALALTAPGAQAAPDPDLTASAARILRTTPVAVSSLNTVPVTVEVDAKYTWQEADPNTTLYALLERTGGSGQLDTLITMPLKRYAGTTRDGSWRGVVNVPSTANGKFALTGVKLGPFNPGNPDTFDPSPVPGPQPTVTVAGSNIPRITARVLPDPVPFGKGYSIRWSVINGQTGKPYGTRLKVWLPNDNGCVESFGGPVALTDTNGYVTKSYAANLAEYLNCLHLPSEPAPSGWLSFFVNRPSIVTAGPWQTSAPVGSIVPVHGFVAGGPFGCPVHLQRLYGATAWRTVNTARVRPASAAFTLQAQPAYKGLLYYRVSFPACDNFKAGVSKTFTIKGL
ncbi:hypothetical protein GCM10029976_059950 [Kribbella albertanoniae]|uniref:Uncharacterized protein n=1 Tax=Kribbella albertanoniae TaxID=1266829 RepID=A0A4R4QHZ3_9ACTN|nr:hypothetical protein [Kribbella albertanoniae]TDC34873.1 hypothetical protein E1261_02945 [Kribbella albertanoniae]